LGTRPWISSSFFPPEIGSEETHPSDIPARPVEARDQVLPDGIPSGGEDDGYRRGSGLGQLRRNGIRHNYSRLLPDQFRDDGRQLVVVVVR
jgi:hypothetical protein